MGVDDLNPSRSRLLSRRPPKEMDRVREAATAVLERLHAEGKLQPVQPWTNEAGVTLQPWPEEDVLGCYMDMLGLNGRKIVEYTSLDLARNAARRRDPSRRNSGGGST